MKKLSWLLVVILMMGIMAFGAESISKRSQIAKTTTLSDIWMNTNRMNGIMRNNGIWFYDNIIGDWGLEWPQGSGLSPIFGAGQWIGTTVNGVPRIAGVIHGGTDFQPGEIVDKSVDPPIAGNSLDANYRWYELRSDGTGDWDNWPVDQGAPVDSLGNPALIGDQTVFSVYNDVGVHNTFVTPKLGVEIRQIAWAFNRADAIGDMVFMKWQIINKSINDWNETYLVIWSDPDIGYGQDDFVGCDTTLGLAFCYNAVDNDQNYGTAPPAVGIDFFQGPIVDAPGETVTLPNGTVIPDKKLLKMTSFIYYNNNDSPQGNPQTGQDAWNYMRGFWKDGTPITEGGSGTDPTAPATKFMFSGDPETNTGWLDQNSSDRRFMMVVGPFQIKKWVDQNVNGQPDFGEDGVQEIVAGVLVGRGKDNLNSVTYLKAIDESAQLTYDVNFELPPAPKMPQVTVSELSNEVILSWDERSEYMSDSVTPYEVDDIVANGLIGQKMVVGDEYVDVTDGTFNFTGYTIYQFSDASGSDPVEYAVYGVDQIADAEPYTGRRYIRLVENKNPKVATVGDQLYNGKEYYFGVQAKAYCRFAKPQVFPSSIAKVTIVPQNRPGERYSAEVDSSLAIQYKAVNPSTPAGDGSVSVSVVDPSKTTGKYYKVIFNADESWSLVSCADSNFVVTQTDTILKNQMNQAGDDAYNVMDGLLVKVIGPPAGIKQIAELNPNTLAIYDANLWGSLNNYGRSQQWPVFVLSENVGTDLIRMDRFGLMTPKDYDIIFTDTDSTLAWDYYTDLVLTNTLTSQPSYVPFTVWKIDLDGTRTRLPVTILDNDGDGRWNRSLTTADGIFGPAFEMLYIYDNAEYKPADVVTYISTNDGTSQPGYGPYGVVYPAINRFMINMYTDVNSYAQPGELDADGYFYGPPHAGEYIRIYTNKPNTSNDQFVFKAPDAKSLAKKDKKEDLDLINVVPNPYYGYHSGEMDIFSRWVQFTNLPEKCTVRIFDLAGNIVRKLEKDDPTLTLLRWDLENEYGLPVAGGVYIFHIDVPGLGEKIGKLAVFTPNERLDTY